jgi:GT2 family glycosyltransferase
VSVAPRVSIVILSHSRPTLIRSAIESALAQDCPNCEVIVVDNWSDASPVIAGIVADYPDVRLIANLGNVGFARGMNIGMAAAAGEYVYITADDIELDRACIRRMVSFLHAHPDTGMVGGVMLNRGDGTVRCAGGHLVLGNPFSLQIVGDGQPPAAVTEGPYDVSYLPGVMMMARRSLFASLGGFREEFLMYSEDIEICCRIRRQGLRIVVVPEAVVSHHDPDGPPGDAMEFHKIRNLAAVYFLHAPLLVIPEFILRYGVLGTIRAAAGGRARAATHLRAWGAVLGSAPRLFAARMRQH